MRSAPRISFEALTSKRPYHNPMPVLDALRLIESERGTRFEPRIIDALVALYNDRQLMLSQVNDARAADLHDRYGSGALLLSRLNQVKA